MASVAAAGGAGQQRVSVVIASHNMAGYLPLAIESVLDQTWPAYEIHVVDDGSQDETQEVLRRFADHPKVVVHLQPNRGQANAKNRGIVACSGDFVAFLDADDMWTPNKLEVQMPVFESRPQIGVVYSNFRYIDEHGGLLQSPERDYHSGWISGPLLVDNFVNGMASIVRRECFEAVGLFDESLPMGIDYDLWLRISAKYQFQYLDEITYLYRQWPGQMSRNWRKRFECAVAIMNKFLAAHPGVVDTRTINEAWAHTFVSRGGCSVRFEDDRGAALRDYLRALGHSPAYMPAWKSIAKLVLR